MFCCLSGRNSRIKKLSKEYIKPKKEEHSKKTRNMFDNICKKSKPLFKGMTNPNPFGQYIAFALENSADNEGKISWPHFEESLRGSLSFIEDKEVKELIVQVGNSCVPRHNCV